MPSPSLPLRGSALSSRRPVTLLAPLLAVLALGCGSHAKQDGAQEANPSPIAECDAFVAAYARCLAAHGPERLADARAEQTRAGLATQIHAAQGDGARAVLQKQCSANLSQLKASCQ
jgi:hypothetical protein